MANSLTAFEFIDKWRRVALNERAAAQEHFIDLCRMLGEPTPAEADPEGEWYCFERGARKDSGGRGWADVWKRGHFAWEHKGRHADLDAAVAAAYGWEPDISEDDALGELLQLNSASGD